MTATDRKKRVNKRFNQPNTIRYHLVMGKRTTISLDKVISNLIAIKLGIDPFSDDAHSEIRQKLEEIIAPHYRRGSNRKPTQFVTEYALLWLVGKTMADEYEDCLAGLGKYE